MYFGIFCHLYSSPKNKFVADRAENAVSLIKANMEISDSDIVFLKETLYKKYVSNALKSEVKI